MYFLTYSAHFDRDKGVDQGRLCLRHLTKGTMGIWISATSYSTKQFPESFHQRGGVIPPEYRVPSLKNWQVLTKPIYLPKVKGVEGNFYKINPHNVVTDKGGQRGDFGIHRDANAPGSLGCIVMSNDRFTDFERVIASLRNEGVDELPLFQVVSRTPRGRLTRYTFQSLEFDSKRRSTITPILSASISSIGFSRKNHPESLRRR